MVMEILEFVFFSFSFVLAFLQSIRFLPLQIRTSQFATYLASLIIVSHYISQPFGYNRLSHFAEPNLFNRTSSVHILFGCKMSTQKYALITG